VAVSRAVSEILSVRNGVTFKSALQFTQGYSKWYHLKAWIRFPIHIP